MHHQTFEESQEIKEIKGNKIKKKELKTKTSQEPETMQGAKENFQKETIIREIIHDYCSQNKNRMFYK